MYLSAYRALGIKCGTWIISFNHHDKLMKLGMLLLHFTEGEKVSSFLKVDVGNKLFKSR